MKRRFKSKLTGVLWDSHAGIGNNYGCGPYPIEVMRVGDERPPCAAARHHRRARLCSSPVPLKPFW